MKKVSSGRQSMVSVIFGFVSAVIIVIALLYLGKYLWNNVLVEVIPGIKPVPSIWYILGLDILFALLL